MSFSVSSSLAKASLANYVVNSNDAVYFRLISTAVDLDSDLADEEVFHPLFSHQIFGESENIFGYSGLKIRLFYSSSRLDRYIGVSYLDKISSHQASGIDADDIMKTLDENFSSRYTTSLDQFSANLSSECLFKPHGELLRSFYIEDRPGSGADAVVVKRQFDVYKADISIPGFREYHEKMQTFLLWFIDAASYIDFDDDRWDFFTIFEKNAQSTNGHGAKLSYTFVGYTTVYRNYAYSEKIRPRISQVLILPPFQRKGLGAQLLNTIYTFYNGLSQVFDITVEDPSENFVRLRDFVDAQNCMKLPTFQSVNLAKGWSEDMAEEARKKLKLSKKQSRRVFEILRLRSIDISNNEEYRKYRLQVKNRLNAPFIRTKNGKNIAEFDGAVTAEGTKEMRMEELKNIYDQLEEEYRHVIERLAAS